MILMTKNRWPSGMSTLSCVLMVIVAVVLAGCASLVRPNFTTELKELRAGQYSLDPDHAFVNFKIDHLGLSYVVGRFNEVDATLDFQPDSPESLQLDGKLVMSSIDFGNPDLEKRIRGRDWFDVEQYPEASFTTTAVSPLEDNRLAITGDFAWRGITEPLTLDVRFNGGADNLLTGKYTLGFTATGTVSRAAYGVDGFAALVGDEIEIEVNAEFQRN